MMKYTLIFLISSTFYRYSVQDTVNITLYYESLCPFCVRFIKDQLYPGYQKLGDSLVIDLVPYGDTVRQQVNGKWKYMCEHGPNECFGNRMHGCVFELYPKTTSQMNFLECVINQQNSTSIDTGKKCAVENNLEWNKIMDCLEGPGGDAVMLQNALLTEAAKGQNLVPWIVVNGDDNYIIQAAIRNNLITTVCVMLEMKPAACTEQE